LPRARLAAAATHRLTTHLHLLLLLQAISAKLGMSHPSLADVAAAAGCPITLAATSLARRAPVYLSSTTHPDMPVRDALRGAADDAAAHGSWHSTDIHRRRSVHGTPLRVLLRQPAQHCSQVICTPRTRTRRPPVACCRHTTACITCTHPCCCPSLVRHPLLLHAAARP
jgi:hypothetical protein